jgi:hypothetical protein
MTVVSEVPLEQPATRFRAAQVVAAPGGVKLGVKPGCQMPLLLSRTSPSLARVAVEAESEVPEAAAATVMPECQTPQLPSQTSPSVARVVGSAAPEEILELVEQGAQSARVGSLPLAARAGP